MTVKKRYIISIFLALILIFSQKDILMASSEIELEIAGETATDESNDGITIRYGDDNKIIHTVEGRFYKKKGLTFFISKDGSKIKKQFFVYKGKVYRTDSKGRLIKGWLKYKGNYYFFDRSSGKLIIDGKADNIKISKKGIAKTSKENYLRIQTYIKAQKIVTKVTKPSDSKKVKLYKCYKWLEKFQYKQFRTMRSAKISHPKDWDVIFANDIFDNHMGCCASEASAFAYLAKSCGYTKVTICSDTGHAWVDIRGRLYDPLFAEARSFSKNYNSGYCDYRSHPAYVKKL